jgi:hypothetical protein
LACARTGDIREVNVYYDLWFAINIKMAKHQVQSYFKTKKTLNNLLFINYHMKIEYAPNFRRALNFFSPILVLEACINFPPPGSSCVHQDDFGL